jgi:hypothetical protein
MDIKLGSEDNLRVDGTYSASSQFLDIKKEDYCCLSVTAYTGFQYIEIRKKDGMLRMFTFFRKSDKKGFDFGVWTEADVVYSCNEQTMNKKT